MNTHSDEHTEHRGRRLRTRRLFPRSENGQVFALMAISILALIGLSGFVVDVGVAYRAHRRAQTTADASALGAAQLLPGDTSLATATANGLRAQNLSEGSIDAPTYSSTYTSNDTVTVTARTTSAGVSTRASTRSTRRRRQRQLSEATRAGRPTSLLGRSRSRTSSGRRRSSSRQTKPARVTLVLPTCQ